MDELVLTLKHDRAISPFTLERLARLPYAHRAQAGDIVGAVRCFVARDHPSGDAHDSGQPMFVLASNGNTPVRKIGYTVVPETQAEIAAVIYTSLRDDHFVSGNAEHFASNLSGFDSDISVDFEFVALRDVAILYKGTYSFWSTEYETKSHLTKLAKDIKVIISPALSKHATLEAIAGAEHFLARDLHRFLDRDGSHPVGTCPVRISFPTGS
jgi:hypothetical protein